MARALSSRFADVGDHAHARRGAELCNLGMRELHGAIDDLRLTPEQRSDFVRVLTEASRAYPIAFVPTDA